MLELELLGPIRLRCDGAALALPVKKTQALLMLLARSGATPRARAVALLWPTLDESTGRRNLRRELARLREAGAADAVEVDADRLALSPQVACDAHAFETAIQDRRPDDALALWRGPPADGLQLDDAESFDDWMALERQRLQDLRRRALEASAAAHEARGAPDVALQRIESLLADDPLQEQRHRDAMRLLAACGRREAALAQYEFCRSVLKAELDLEPMAETAALAATLRAKVADVEAGSTAPAAPTTPVCSAATVAVLLPEQLPFVGRAAEVAALEDAWRSGRALLLEGEAGVGKTRLATDLAASHGPYALARCRPGDADVPYAAFARALRVLAGPTPALGELPPWVGDELARLLPEIGTAPPPMRTEQERSRFIEACTQAWLAFAADSFDAVILDDWHHADGASSKLLGYIAQRRREGTPGAVLPGAREVLVYRPQLEAEAAVSLARLREGALALHLRLQPLPAAAVLDLVRRLSGVSQPTRFAARIAQATAGNPFFLGETLRHLAEQGLLEMGPDGAWRTPFDEATQDYRELPVPASVHDVVLARVQRLPAASRRVLEAAALATEPFAPALLAPACALSELDAVLAIEQAVEVQLLREHEAGGYAFAHDLVQQALDATLSVTRRRLVHRRLALGAQAADAPAAVIALHHEASGEAQRAVMYRLAAGDEAQRLHVLADAAQHWQQGLADAPTPSQALELQLRLMHVLAATGDMQGLHRHGEALRALVADSSLPLDKRCNGWITVAGLLARNEKAQQGLDLLAQLPDTLSAVQQAQSMNVRAAALRRLGRVDESRTAARQALDMPALPAQDRIGLLDNLALAEGSDGRPQEAIRYAEAMIELAGQHGLSSAVVRGKYLRGNDLLILGRLDESEIELREAAALCARYGLVGTHRAVLFSLCALHSTQSRHVQLLQAAREAWSLQPALPVSEMRLKLRVAMIEAHQALGDLGAAWEQAAAALCEARSINEPASLAYWVTSSLELFALLGQSACAAPLLESLPVSALRQMPQYADEVYILVARVALGAGDIDGAKSACREISAPGKIADPRVRAMRALVDAGLALAEGDAAEALRLLPAHDAPGLNDELRLRTLALEVQAQAWLGALNPATLALAQAELLAPGRHAVARLLLLHALADTCRSAMPGAAAPALSALATDVALLAASLHPHPELRAAFLRRCA